MTKEERLLQKVQLKISKIFISAEKKGKDYFKTKNKAQRYALKKGVKIQINEEW